MTRYAHHRFLYFSRYLALVLALVACQAPPSDDPRPRGQILLWHSLDEAQTVVLDELLGRFIEINPEAEIISLAVPPEALLQRYRDTASLGLGPDLLIAPAIWIGDLAQAGLIRSLTRADFGANDYVAPAILAARAGETIYGLPLSVAPPALYYHRDQVTSPPDTLEELLAEAEAGQEVAMSAAFDQAYWGIGAFGGGLFDLAGEPVLADSGFAGWLAWLKSAQEAPGVVLLRDGDVLLDLFIAGRVAYLVAGPERLGTLREAVPAEQLGVAPLPAGPAGPAAPLIQAQAAMINAASSPRQAALALALAQFLTNAEQSIILMREAGLVPANRRIQVDNRVFPQLASFVAARQGAVVVPGDLPWPDFFAVGDAIYANVLAGVLTPDEAVCQFAREVNVLRGRPPDAALPPGCPAGG